MESPVRRLIALAVAMTALAACSTGPHYRFGKPACQADFTSWHVGLTWDVMQGPGDGTFDFDPEGEVEARAFGEYDLASGNFVYTTTYDPEHYRDETRVEGSGLVSENGDLDLLQSAKTTDTNGDDWTIDARIERQGCNETVSVISNGHLYVTEGTYGPAGYEYTREIDEGDGGTVEGAAYSDLTYEESYEQHEGTFDYEGSTEGDSGEGYARTDWTQSDSGWSAEGYTESFLDGSTHQSYTYSGDSDYEWDVTVDYDGNGSGTYTSGSTSCPITYDSGTCTVTCDGTDYDC